MVSKEFSRAKGIFFYGQKIFSMSQRGSIASKIVILWPPEPEGIQRAQENPSVVPGGLRALLLSRPELISPSCPSISIENITLFQIFQKAFVLSFRTITIAMLYSQYFLGYSIRTS